MPTPEQLKMLEELELGIGKMDSAMPKLQGRLGDMPLSNHPTEVPMHDWDSSAFGSPYDRQLQAIALANPANHRNDPSVLAQMALPPQGLIDHNRSPVPNPPPAYPTYQASPNTTFPQGWAPAPERIAAPDRLRGMNMLLDQLFGGGGTVR